MTLYLNQLLGTGYVDHCGHQYMNSIWQAPRINWPLRSLKEANDFLIANWPAIPQAEKSGARTATTRDELAPETLDDDPPPGWHWENWGEDEVDERSEDDE